MGRRRRRSIDGCCVAAFQLATMALVSALVGSCLLGCKVQGKRTFTVEALGQKIVIVDEVSPNDQGEQEYLVSFDEAGLNVIGWVIDLFRPEPADEPAEGPAGTGTEGDDDG